MQVFLAGINGATSVAQTFYGGGTTSDMPWRDKDKDYLHWACEPCSMLTPSTILATKLRKSKGY